MGALNVCTIGFTKTTAARFFDRIRLSGAKTVVDVRLHNTSQLAGFAKAEDLAFFLKSICNVAYVHKPILAPTDDILKAYKKEGGDWGTYKRLFLNLMADRRIEERLEPDSFANTCLLCSEDKPHNCHRQLVCEYLNGKWGNILRVKHL